MTRESGSREDALEIQEVNKSKQKLKARFMVVFHYIPLLVIPKNVLFQRRPRTPLSKL